MHLRRRQQLNNNSLAILMTFSFKAVTTLDSLLTIIYLAVVL